jgi:hypothetical protein
MEEKIAAAGVKLCAMNNPTAAVTAEKGIRKKTSQL